MGGYTTPVNGNYMGQMIYTTLSVNFTLRFTVYCKLCMICNKTDTIYMYSGSYT